MLSFCPWGCLLLTGSKDRFMLCLSRPEMFGFITKDFGGACTLTHTHTHIQSERKTPPAPECHTCLSSAALLCWWWTKWSIAVYMDRTSSHWSQPLAFYWIFQVSPHKCWLVYYRHCLLMQSRSEWWLLSSSSLLWKHVLFPSSCINHQLMHRSTFSDILSQRWPLRHAPP